MKATPRHLTPSGGLLNRVRAASSGTIKVTIIAVAIAFVPSVVLVSLRGFGSFRSFLLDWAAQTRFWIVMPVLIFAERPLVARQKAIGQHFLDEGLVEGEDRARVEAALATFLHMGNSLVATIIMIVVVYVAILLILPSVKTGVLLRWLYGGGGIANLSPAGSWYVVVSLPLLAYLLLRWCWRQIIWARFLRTTTRTALHLISSHPDSKAGLGFVGTCLRAYYPFGFALGTLVAGGVANRIAYSHEPLSGFKYTPLFLLALVLLVCVSPLCVFLGTLLRAKRLSIFRYGKLATAMGRKFEEKWLAAENQVDAAALESNDFSATTDLYSIVANVYKVTPFPVEIRTAALLCVATLIPAIPVIFAALPFEMILQRFLKLVL
jgi:hypothetical protein